MVLDAIGAVQEEPWDSTAVPFVRRPGSFQRPLLHPSACVSRTTHSDRAVVNHRQVGELLTSIIDYSPSIIATLPVAAVRPGRRDAKRWRHKKLMEESDHDAAKDVIARRLDVLKRTMRCRRHPTSASMEEQQQDSVNTAELPEAMLGRQDGGRLQRREAVGRATLGQCYRQEW